MKRIFLCAIISVFSLCSIAQPIITDSANSPIISNFFYSYRCDTNGVLAGVSGAGVTWDFSALVTQLASTIFVDSCEGTTYCDSFPGTTIDLQVYGGNQFYLTNINEWAATGIAQGSLSEYYSHLYKMVSYPFTYNTIVVDTSILYTLSGYFYTQIDTFIGDGYGTLILPSGTYSNVLRMHRIIHETDSMAGDPAVTYLTYEEYWWFQPGFHEILLELNYFDLSGQYLANVVYNSKGTTGIAPLNYADLNLEISPNPASDVISIKFNLQSKDNIEISLLDILGRVVGKVNDAEIKNGANEITYSLSGLSPGIYFIHLKSDGHNITRKIIVAH